MVVRILGVMLGLWPFREAFEADLLPWEREDDFDCADPLLRPLHHAQ